VGECGVEAEWKKRIAAAPAALCSGEADGDAAPDGGSDDEANELADELW
jgi:hypothetical protein